MALFPLITTDSVVQMGDKVRLDATASFANGVSSITSVEIKPSASDSYITVTDDKYLDWVYSAAASVTATVRLNGGADTKDVTFTVCTSATDNLFSTDEKLKLHEPEILNYLPAGRSSFKFVHRRAQALIIAWLDKEGYVNSLDNKFSKEDIVDVDEVAEWSTAMALRLIFQGMSNAVDDVFDRKSKYYLGLEQQQRERAVLRLDVNEDGTVDDYEQIDIRSGLVVRR